MITTILELELLSTGCQNDGVYNDLHLFVALIVGFL